MDNGGGLVSAISEIAREIVRQELAKLQSAAVAADEGERLLSLAQVGERTDASVSTVRRWIADGVLPTVSVPSRIAGKERVRVRQSDLDRWIRGLPARLRQRGGDDAPVVTHPRPTRGRPAAGRTVAGRAPVSGLDAEIQKRREQRGVAGRPARQGTRTAR